jgi:hypothetical protein
MEQVLEEYKVIYVFQVEIKCPGRRLTPVILASWEAQIRRIVV